MTNEEFEEARDSLDAPARRYVLLVMFPYYNHLFGPSLLRAGFVVRWTSTLDGAYERMRRACPGAVISWVGGARRTCSLAVDAPGIAPDCSRFLPLEPDGLALLRAMHAPEFEQVLSVAVVQQEEDVAKAIEAGAARGFVVPFAPIEVVRYVQERMPSFLESAP